MGRIAYQIVFLLVLCSVFPFVEVSSVGSETYQNEDPSRDLSDLSVSICDWRWNRTSAVSLTYDDGLNSQAHVAAPLMSERGFVGTFFITTDNCEIPYGANWTDWQNVSDMGHEIGSHTISHPDLRTLSSENLTKEVVGSSEIIEENLTGVDVETFSYPMGRYNDTILQLVAANYLAARMDSHNITGPPKPESKHPENLYSVVPCNFGSGQTASDLSDLLNDTIDTEGWLVEMIHAVGSGGYDPVSLADFTTHLDLLVSKEEDLWVDTFLNVSKYIREREHSQVQITSETDDHVNISLASPLSEEHDMPLTLDIRFPSDWKDVDINIDGSKEHISLTHLAFYSRLYIDVKINSDISIVKNNTPPDLLSGVYSEPVNPKEGNSDTEFHFYAVYQSEMWRPLQGNISLLLDLNNDGDSLDEIKGMSESVYYLEYITQADCPNGPVIYGIDLMFPPGIHNPGFSIQGMDSAGLYAREPKKGYFRGPMINNPPPAPEDLKIMNYHDLAPTFNLEEVEDPDGDNVTYNLVLMQNDSVVWMDSTKNNSFISPELEFDLNYTLVLNATDELGLSSGNVSLNFTLGNSPPDEPANVTASNLHSLSPIISWDTPIDPDGDNVTALCTFSTYVEWSYYNVTFKTNDTRIEIEYPDKIGPSNHWFKTVQKVNLQFQDEYGGLSSNKTFSFKPENDAPEEVGSIMVADERSYGPNITFSRSFDPNGDNVTYVTDIDRYLDNGGMDIGIYHEETMKTYIDLPDIFHEGDYRISVTAWDSLNMVSKTTYQNFTIDLRPDPVQIIYIEDRGSFEGGVYLNWEYPHVLLDEIDGFYVYAYSSNPLIYPDITPLQKLDVWRNRETWVGNLTDGQEYWFTVVAYYSEGKESEMQTYVYGIPYDLIPPPTARMLQIDLMDPPYGCKLQWQITDPFDIEKILIYRAEDEAPFDASYITPIHVIDDWKYQGTTWLDTSIEENRVYYYCIVTMDENGNAITGNLFWMELNTSVETDHPDEEHDIEVPEDSFFQDSCLVPIIVIIIAILALIIGFLILSRSNFKDDISLIEE